MSSLALTTTVVPYRGIHPRVVTPDPRPSGSLPADTIAEGVRRLGWPALVYAIGNISGPLAPVPPGLRSEFTIPPALDALIMECLAKDPAVRPASAVVVSERLAAAISRDVWTHDTAHDWWERHQPRTSVNPLPQPLHATTMTQPHSA